MRTALAILCLGGLLLAAAPLAAQEEGTLEGKTVSLDLRDVTIRDAVHQLALQAGIDYIFADEPKGTVTLTLPDTPAESALRSVLAAGDMTWRLEDGVYVIENKPAPETEWVPGPKPTYQTPPAPPTYAPGPTAAPGPATGAGDELIIRKIPVKHADPAEIAMIFGGSVIPSAQGMLMRAGGGMGPRGGIGGPWGGSPWGGIGGPWGGSPWGGNYGGLSGTPYRQYGGRISDPYAYGGSPYGYSRRPYGSPYGYSPYGYSPYGSYNGWPGGRPTFGYPY